MTFSFQAAAENGTRLAASGGWTLYRNADFEAAMGGGKHVTSAKACVAKYGNQQSHVEFMAFPAQFNRSQSEYAGAITLQVTAEAWNFRSRTSSVNFGDGLFDMIVTGTIYDGDSIMVNLGGLGSPPALFTVAAEQWRGTVTITDEKKRKLWSFTANGLKTIYPKLLACGGL